MVEQMVVAVVVALTGLWAGRRVYHRLQPKQAIIACGGCPQPCAGAPSTLPEAPCCRGEEESPQGHP
jgi:uncharacterized membrane protein YqiK